MERSTALNGNLKQDALERPAGAGSRPKDARAYCCCRSIQYSAGTTATAFDARLLNTLPPEYTLNLGSISITTGAGASGVTNNSTGNTIDFTVDSIPSNGFARVEYTATLNSSLQPNTTLTDTASVTYTSLPGANGTTSNPTGSSTSGASGAELGERDGSQSRSASTNDYRRIRTASLTSNSPTIAKQLVSTEIVSASNSNTQAVIGEYVTYRVTVTVPEGTTNLASIVDTLDSGLAYVNLESAVLSSGLTISGSTTPAITSSGRVITWNFGTVTNSNTDNGVAETITLTYRVVAVNQPLRPLAVKRGALALDIRPMRPTDAGAFVPVETHPAQGIDKSLHGPLHGALLVGVLDAQDELAAVLAGEHPVVERGARPADMQIARGAGCESYAYGHTEP